MHIEEKSQLLIIFFLSNLILTLTRPISTTPESLVIIREKYFWPFWVVDPLVAGGCMWLQVVAGGCMWLQVVAGVCMWLHVVAGVCMWLHVVAGGWRWLQVVVGMVEGGYRWFQEWLQVVAGGVKWLPSVESTPKWFQMVARCLHFAANCFKWFHVLICVSA